MSHFRIFMRILFYFVLVISTVIGLPLAQSEAADSKAKEYEDAVVLLIDVPSGMLGVEIEDELTHLKRKLSFLVNSKDVYVTNPMNQNLEFSNIRPGDRIDFIVSVNKDGKEEVTDITDYNQVEKD